VSKPYTVQEAEKLHAYHGIAGCPDTLRILATAAALEQALNEKASCSDGSCGRCAACYEVMREEYNTAVDEAREEVGRLRAEVRRLNGHLKDHEAVLDEIANIPEVDAVPGGGADAVRTALQRLQLEIEHLKSELTVARAK
jgi:hypothetical protein